MTGSFSPCMQIIFSRWLEIPTLWADKPLEHNFRVGVCIAICMYCKLFISCYLKTVTDWSTTLQSRSSNSLRLQLQIHGQIWVYEEKKWKKPFHWESRKIQGSWLELPILTLTILDDYCSSTKTCRRYKLQTLPMYNRVCVWSFQHMYSKTLLWPR